MRTTTLIALLLLTMVGCGTPERRTVEPLEGAGAHRPSIVEGAVMMPLLMVVSAFRR